MEKKIKKTITNSQVNFTSKQLELLALWSETGSAKATAVALGVSRHTVYTQLKRMRKKIKAKRTFEVYKYAKERKLI